MPSRTLRSAAAAAAFVVLAGVAQPAAAWNDHGHMLVAAVAWGKMTPQARAKAGALLKLNPLYGAWTAGVPANQRAATAFIKAATWPDIIKGAECKTGKDPQPTPPNTGDDVWHGAPGKICYIKDGSTPKAGDPITARNLGYADMRMHKYWHYKDLPFAVGSSATEDPPEPNAATQIKTFRDALKTGTEAQQAYDLAWLLHMVGDIHQPLHAASRFVGGKPDNGGNSVIVCVGPCTARTKQTLHSYWDGALGSVENVAALRKEAQSLCNASAVKLGVCDKPRDGAAEGTDVDAWLTDSLELAKTFAYGAPVGPEAGPAYPLNSAYAKDAARVARSQVALGGARLAKLLNEALGV